MKKTYWWRVAFLLVSILLYFVIDGYSFRLFDYGEWKNYADMIEGHFIVIFFIFPVLLFVSDVVFFRWVWFAVSLFAISFLCAIPLILSQASWMLSNYSQMSGSIFFIASFLLIEYGLWSERKQSTKRFYLLSFLIVLFVAFTFLLIHQLRTDMLNGLM